MEDANCGPTNGFHLGFAKPCLLAFCVERTVNGAGQQELGASFAYPGRCEVFSQIDFRTVVAHNFGEIQTH